jgi:RND superfamily putative drug exporter
MAGLTDFSYRHRWAVLAVVAVWFVVALVVLSGRGKLSAGVIHGLESERAQKLSEQVTQRPIDTTFAVIFEAPGMDPTSAPFRKAMGLALAPLARDARVASVTMPEDEGPAAEGMLNRSAGAAVAFVSVAGDFSRAVRAYPALRAMLHSDQLTITCTGRLPFVHDLDRILEEDLVKAEAISLPFCLVLLWFIFGSVMAALVPVLVGALSVVSGLAVVVLLSRFMDMAQYTLNVCSLIGLGVAIDYSLFFVSRYREELASGHDRRDALSRAGKTAGRVVLFSGLAVATGLAGLFFFPRSYLFAMGLGGSMVVAFAVLFALTFLPALVAVLGSRIPRAGQLPANVTPSSRGFWHRLASSVMRRPVLVLVPCLALLVVMGLPFRRVRLASSDVRVLPPDVEAREGYELLRKEFPELGQNHVLIAVDFPSSPALNDRRVEALFDFARRLSELPFVTKVNGLVDPAKPIPRSAWPTLLSTPPASLAPMIEAAKRKTVGKTTVLVDVVTDQPPESDAARAVVRAVRSEREVADGEVYVGGQTASDLDAAEYIRSRAPRVVAFVVLVTFGVLFMLLRSVLLPVKAVLMNFLSIVGSFGAIVWVFQEGHLFVRDPRPIDPSLPVVLFCSLFGLSMDYEVLILTRIKEAYSRTGDNTLAVAEGLEMSGRIITSAAAIMVTVFVAFALARVVVIQAVGFGMALAVALDATVVRSLLVPSTMRLMGHLNWWAPRALSKGAPSRAKSSGILS